MMTLNELIAKYNTIALSLGLPTRKSFENKAKAEAAIAALPKPKKSGAALRVRKAAAIREAGPRGFKFGRVWLSSIKSGKGVALKTANMPKLLATAAAHNVSVTQSATQEQVIKLIAAAL